MCKCRSCWWKRSTAAQERLPAGRRRPSSPPQREHIKRMRGAAVLPLCWSQISQRKKKNPILLLSDDTFSTSRILKFPLLENITGKARKRRWVPAEVMVMLFFFYASLRRSPALSKVTRTQGLGASESSNFNNCPVTIKLMQGSRIFLFPCFCPRAHKKVP